MMAAAAAVAGGRSIAPSKYLAIGMQNTDNLQIFDVATSTQNIQDNCYGIDYS